MLNKVSLSQSFVESQLMFVIEQATTKTHTCYWLVINSKINQLIVLK